MVLGGMRFRGGLNPSLTCLLALVESFCGLTLGVNNMSVLRQDVPWTPSIAAWDRDSRWDTHLDRIAHAQAYATDRLIDQREQVLEGSRKIRWWSILDVECPVCGACVGNHCKTLNIE